MRRIWGSSVLGQLRQLAWEGAAQTQGGTSTVGRTRRFNSYYANGNRIAEVPREPHRQVSNPAALRVLMPCVPGSHYRACMQLQQHRSASGGGVSLM